MSELSHGNADANDTARMLLRILYLQCRHCDAWAPSRSIFWYFEGFQQVRRRGATNCCSLCFKPNLAHEQRYRAYLSDGQLLEG
jgi:hypothetical protein